MTHIEELKVIKDFSATEVGTNETTKLEKEIIAMEMSLSVFQNARKSENEK